MAQDSAESTAQVPTVIDSDLDELAGITREDSPAAPDSEPEKAAAATEESKTTAEPAEAGEQATTPQQQPSAPKAPTATPPTYTIGGKKFTAEEIAANPQILQDLVASHGKLPNVSRSAAEATERARALEAQLAAGRPPENAGAPRPASPPGSPGLAGLSPAQVTAAIRPVVEAAVKDGWIEADLAEIFPTFAAQAVLHRDLIYDVRAAVAEINAWRRGLETRETVTNTRSEWNSALDGLAGEGDLFVPLKDREGEIRKEFETFMVENFGHLPKDKVLNSEFLGRQWLAFNYGPVQEALRAAGEQSKERIRTRRAQASGEGVAGGRTGATAKSDDFDPDLLPEGYRFPAARR